MWADITLSERQLDWEPQVSLPDGINRIIDKMSNDGDP
jgi:nucleoside-diphosphate-sugar epimerase